MENKEYQRAEKVADELTERRFGRSPVQSSISKRSAFWAKAYEQESRRQ